MAETKPDGPKEKALKHFYDARAEGHDEFVEKVEQRYKTYKGVLDKQSDAADWVSKSHPPYIMHIVETSLASLIDDKLRFTVRPNPSLHELIDPQASERARMGAEAHQILFNWQIEQDAFSDKQRAFILQNAIAGLTVAKTYWIQRQERRRTLVSQDGGMGMLFQERESLETIYDGPTTEVRDVRDFFWAPNATSLETSPYVIDRLWKTPHEVYEGFKDGGPFGPDRGGVSLEECKRLIAEGTQKEEISGREQELRNIDRTKGLIEVIEVWDNEEKTVTWVANRSVLLAHRTSFPFFHDAYPFVVCSTQPDLFAIPGVSQVEKIAHLQTLLWDVANQSLDNLRLVNNAIFMFRPDVEDVDAYEFYPGARWFVEDPSQVVPWAPNPLPAEVSLNREALIKGDMQNLAGGFPFSSGTDSQFVDQKTATGASIVSSLAQKSMDLAKQELYKAWRKIGQQRLVLNQQFIREPQVAPVMGMDSTEELQVIWPELLKGDYSFKLEPQADAMRQQEEQASSQALMQMALAAFPVITAAAQNGSATPIDLDQFMKDLLKAFGKENPDAYFSKSTAAVMPPTGGTGGGIPGAPSLPGQSPMGVTGPQSIDPAVSPSSSMSLSPVANLQRAQALDRS